MSRKLIEENSKLYELISNVIYVGFTLFAYHIGNFEQAVIIILGLILSEIKIKSRKIKESF